MGTQLMTQTAVEKLREMLTCGTPIIPYYTLDCGESIASIVERIPDRPYISWNLAQGMFGLNEDGKRELMRALPPPDPATGEPVNVKALTTNPVDALTIADKFGPRTILFLAPFFPSYVESEAVVTALWVLRDSNKSKLRCVIPMGQPIVWPQALAQDVMPIDEPPPSPAIIEGIIESTRLAYNKSQKKKNLPEIPPYDPDAIKRGADAGLGLSASAVEQAVALNTNATGLNVSGLWSVKIDKIGQQKGINIHRGDERLEDYIGYEYAVWLMKKMVTGRMGIRGLWLWDEIDKDFSGNAGDNTGVSQELHGKILKNIQNRRLPCLLFAGVWGTGKTQLVKAIRNAAPGGEISMVESSLAEMKSGVVGSSMTAFLNADKVGMALTGNRPLIIFTANSLKPLSPEFRSRMLVQLFFEQPNEAQLAGLWKTYMRTYEIKKQPIPESVGWVGREVEACCRIASDLEITLVEAARGIIPQTISSADKLRAMRMEANNALVDANTGGPYVYKFDGPALPPGRERAFDN